MRKWTDDRASLIEIADEIVQILTTSVGRPHKAVYDEVMPLCKEYTELRRSPNVPRNGG